MKRRRGSHPKSFGFIDWVDNVNWPPLTDSKADVSSVSPTSERIEGLWVVDGTWYRGKQQKNASVR